MKPYQVLVTHLSSSTRINLNDHLSGGKPIYPYLPLEHLSIDIQIARCLPQRLAYYHLAIPIAQEEEAITVAMMHPENETALNIFRNVLNASIVPVRSDPKTIKKKLDQIWFEDAEGNPMHLLSWCEDSEHMKWCGEYAALFADALAASVTRVDTEGSELLSAFDIAREGNYDLFITDLTRETDLPVLITQAPTSLLLIRGAARPIRRILHILRGHAPDQNVLTWIAPLAKFHTAEVTLLSVLPSHYMTNTPTGTFLMSSLADLLSNATPSGQHLTSCINQLAEAGIQGYSKILEGDVEQVIIDEITHQNYDLVAVAAEAYGNFVSRVLSGIQQTHSHTIRAFLVTKP